jgi:hypothetical protein
MRARFIGDPRDNFSGPDVLTCWGVEFVKGEWTEVDDPRFASHSHFEVDEGGVAAPAEKPVAKRAYKRKGGGSGRP